MFFASDGELYVGFSGNYNFLLAIKNYFDLDTNIHEDKSIYSLRVGGKMKPFRLLEEMYGDATIYLDRKYEIYKEAKEKFLKQ